MCIQLLAGLLPIAYLIFSKKKFYFSFVLYLVLSVITTLGLIITIKLKIQNYWMTTFYSLTSFLCLMHYFHQINFTKINYPIIFSLIFIVVFFIDSFSKTSFLLILLIFFVITCCMMFFVSTTKKQNQTKDFETVSIINASLLFYFSFSFIFLSLLLKLINSHIWEIHNIIESATKLLFTYAFWKLPKTYQ